MACVYNRISTYFKTLYNSNKYTAAKNGLTSYSALIYGASTTIGKVYAKYLLEKGFNLILIERDKSELDKLEWDLSKLKSADQIITTIVIDKFD